MKKILLLALIICGLSVYGQIDISKNKIFYEKVYLHTDREQYVSGETIWYAAYLLNAQDDRLLNVSKTLYVDIIDFEQPEKGSVLNQIIRLEDGLGGGDFEIPKTIKTGKYYIRAWTNWIRNFEDNFQFQKVIEIKNTEPIENTPEKLAGLSKNNISPKKQETVIYNVEDTPFKLSFFPEGGSLIDGVQSNIAFHYLQPNNQNIALDAEVYDSKNNLLANFSSKIGYGSFTFTPDINETYIVKSKFSNGSESNLPLPKVLPYGYSIKVLQKDSVFNLVFNSNNKNKEVGKDVLLVVKFKNRILLEKQFTFKEGVNRMLLPKSQLATGINVITLYDVNGVPQLERLVYNEDLKANNLLNVHVNKAVFKNKESVKVSLDLINDTNGLFSISAVSADDIPKNKTNIQSYMLLESEIKSGIAKVADYFDVKDPQRNQKIDLVLLTQGWRDYVWKKILQDKPQIKYLYEEGISLTGQVRNALTEKPFVNQNISMFVNKANGQKLFSTESNDKGVFTIENINILNKETARINTLNEKGKEKGWLTVDTLFKPFTFYPKKDNILEFTNNEGFNFENIVKKSDYIRKYGLKDTIELDEVTVKSKRIELRNGDEFVDLGFAPEVFDITDKDHDYQDLRHYLLANTKTAIINEEGGYSVLRFGHGRKGLGFPRFVVANTLQDQVSYEELEDAEGYNSMSIEDEGEDLESKLEILAFEKMYAIQSRFLDIRMDKVIKIEVRRLGDIQRMVRSGSVVIPETFLVFLTLKDNAFSVARTNKIYPTLKGYYDKKEFAKIYNDPLNNNKYENLNTVFWKSQIKIANNGHFEINFPNNTTSKKVRIAVEGVSSKGNAIYKEVEYQTE